MNQLPPPPPLAMLQEEEEATTASMEDPFTPLASMKDPKAPLASTEDDITPGPEPEHTSHHSSRENCLDRLKSGKLVFTMTRNEIKRIMHQNVGN